MQAESSPGYCDQCEIHTTIKRLHHCSVCYQGFCEKCYYDIVYDDDLCERCFRDMERESKRSIKRKLQNITDSIKILYNEHKKYKQTQGLLVALETVSLYENISLDTVKQIKYIIKELLLHNKSLIVDNDVDQFTSIIEKLSGLQIETKRKNPEWYTFEITIK